MNELGDLLRAAREAKGVSLAEVEETTRIRGRYLEALESGDYAGLPARVYAEGFVRNYALYLGLSPQEMLALYRRARQEKKEEVAETPPPTAAPVQEAIQPLRMPRKIGRIQMIGAAIVVVILAFLVLAGFLYIQYLSGQPAGAPVVAPTATTATAATPTATFTPPPQPTLLPTFTPTATPVAGVQIEVLITERAWLRVTVDGEMVFEGLLEVGEYRAWTGKEKVILLSGNAAGTNVTVNGVRKGPLGSPSEVVELTWTKP